MQAKIHDTFVCNCEGGAPESPSQAAISRAESILLHGVAAEGPMAADRSADASRLLSAVRLGTETMIRVTPALSVVAAALVALTPLHAFAQSAADNARVNVRERDRPEYDPLGLRLGGFRADASLGLSAESTDNLRAAEEGGADPVIDDVIYAVTPFVQLGSTWSRHAFSVQAGGASVTHQDTESEDYETYFVGANGRLDIGSRTAIIVQARTATSVEPRTDADGSTSGAPIEYDESSASLALSHTFNRLRLIGRVGGSEREFDTDILRNEAETFVTARAEFALSPRVALIGQVTESEREFENQTALSSEGRTYLAGLGVTISNLLRGQVTAGQFTRDYDSGETVDGAAIDANLEWYVTGITTLSGFASRNAEESGANSTSSYVAENLGLRIDHELLRNLILSGGYSIGRRDYSDIDREDETSSAILGAEYFLNRRVALELQATYEDNSSSGVNRYRDFEETRLLAGVTLRL